MILNKILHVHEFGRMDERGYQSCIECGKSFYVGLPEVIPVWNILERVECKNKSGLTCKLIFVQQCKQTGELRSFNVKI